MAAIKVHGSPMSTATQRVLAALVEKDLQFEFVKVDIKTGEHKKEPFLSINPFGQVPGYEEGDLKLFESRAITQHIAHSNPDKGTELLCKGQALSILGVWIEVEGHQFDPVASKLCWELGYKPLLGMTVDEATVEEQEAKLGQVLDVYEKRLSESKYLACGCFTLADLHHLPTLQILMATQSKKLFDARPHVGAWAADILARPAWAKVMDLKKH